MRLIEGLDALQALDLVASHGETQQSRSVVSVGVFDGVHLGHQRLLHQLLEMSSALQAVPTVITFGNHPDQVLHGKAPPLLVSVPHRQRLLWRAGVQRLVLLTFEQRLQNMSPREFAERVLVRSLRTRGLLLGYDSALGKDRTGTPQQFRELGTELGFEVRTGTPFEVDGQPVSSTAIRDAIARGDLALAHRNLGRFPGALGTVVRGAQRGRTLGFPTANLVPQDAVLPPAGVYAVEAIVDGVTFPAVANLGTRPTFQGSGNRLMLEVHIFDFEQDLYGRDLEVMFRQYLRPERRFENAEQLRAQIVQDTAQARACLKA
jgi:riboflavin kinase/FMN adenylyltransferase